MILEQLRRLGWDADLDAPGADGNDRAALRAAVVGAEAQRWWAAREAGSTAEVAGRLDGEGPLVEWSPDRAIEEWTIEELMSVHALAGLAWRDPVAAARLRRAAAWHVMETQPDHATNLPWGLPGFARFPEGRPLAEQQWSAAQTLLAGGSSPVGFADAGGAMDRSRRLMRPLLRDGVRLLRPLGNPGGVSGV